MSLKVFIPPPDNFGTVEQDSSGVMRVAIDPVWYLFFSRTIGGSTLSDAELLAALDSDVDPTAVAAQNAADEARLLAHAFDNPPKDESRNIEDVKLSADTQPSVVAELAELRKEVQNLRVLIETT